MRDSHDKYTIQIGELPKLRGRPATGKAKTAAERQKQHRERMRIKEKKILNELKTAHKECDNYDLANAFNQNFCKSIPGNNESAEQNAKRIWTEIGRRRGWL